MRSILKLQDAIYKQYSLYMHGEKRRLSPQEREMLEIFVKIEEGSSIIEFIPKPIIDAIAKKVKSMSAKEFIVGIACVTIAATLYVSVGKIIDNKAKIRELEIQSQLYTDIQKNAVEAQIEMIKAQTDFYREIVKQGGATEVEINGEMISTEEIKSITTLPKIKHEVISEQITDDFKVTDIHIDDSYVFVDIISTSGQIIKNVQLLEGLVDQDDYQMLKDSTDRKIMNMNILIQKKNDVIISSILNGINK